MHSELLRELTARYAKALAVFEAYVALHDRTLQDALRAADDVTRLGSPTDARGKQLLLAAAHRAKRVMLQHNDLCDEAARMGVQLATAKAARDALMPRELGTWEE